MGFFVAGFVREDAPDAMELAEEGAEAAEEWNGFDEDEDAPLELARMIDSPPAGEPIQPKRKSTKRKKGVE